MKKKLLLLCLGILLFCSTAHADQLGFTGGLVYYTDTDTSINGVACEPQADTGYNLGISYKTDSKYIISAFYERTKRAIEIESPIVTTGHGSDFTTERLMLSAVKQFPLCEKTSFNFGGGAGYSMNHMTDGDAISQANNQGANLGLSVKSSFSYELITGITYEFTPEFTIDLTGKYVWNNPKASLTTTTETIDGRLNLDTWVLGINVAYWFDLAG